MRTPPPLPSMIAVLLAAASATAQQLADAEVLAHRRLVLRAGVDGLVEQVAAAEGQAVDRDEVLVTVRAPELRAAIAVAEATLHTAEVALEAAKLDEKIAAQRFAISERDLKIAAEQIEGKREAVDLAASRLANAEDLYKAGRQSIADVQQARIEHSRAKEQWATIGERVKAGQEHVEIARLERERARLAIAGAEAALHRRRAELDAARERYDRTSLRAPFAGRVRAVAVVPGAAVEAGRTPLLELVDATRVVLRMQVDQATARALEPGAEVRVMLTAQGAPAKVASIDPVADRKTGARTIRVELDNADGQLVPGQRVGVSLPSR